MSSKQADKSILQPLSREKDQPVFDEQWQVQALGMADLLIQTGLINASQWSQTLGKHLEALQTSDADTMKSYYQAVLQSLEELMQQQNLLTHNQIDSREQAWKDAYLSTPHGQPVVLKETHNE